MPAASKDCIVVNHWLLTPFTMSFHQWLIDVAFPRVVLLEVIFPHFWGVES